ncbi:hypothetical protein HHI36_010464 [Cryptolaemus montrouzieri]|uniref:Mitochondrial 2-oxodicarboxylate carrier n=1 Tax=Cryptolaemus montrouzieri TaxID=559131 RepID=A0ABD2MIV5_9CUCU
MTNEDFNWKRSAIQFVSGGVAGFVETGIMHPLDLVKTRLQLQKGPVKKNDPNYYTGIIDCFTKLSKQEGTLSFWKGILPPLIIETPTKSVRFTAFHHYKRLFSKGKDTTVPVYMTCGYLAGITESFVICPFEVVKVTQQANRGHISQTPSAWKTAMGIIEEEGFFGSRGIYRGLGPTMYRQSFFCAVYLGLFYPGREYFSKTGRPIVDSLIGLVLAVITGSCGSVVNIPFDVVKSVFRHLNQKI